MQPISYVFAHGVKETIYILFWVYAGNLYDSEQSKRLFPFFAGSVLVGKILGGVIGAAIAPIIHAENFIGAQAVGFFVCFVALIAQATGSRRPVERRPAVRAGIHPGSHRAIADRTSGGQTKLNNDWHSMLHVQHWTTRYLLSSHQIISCLISYGY